MNVDRSNTDPSQNFIARYSHYLDPLFLPKSVAVIGAKDDAGSVAGTILRNLLNGAFKGTVYPVNPKRSTVMGLPSFSSISAIPERVDLAVIVTPAGTVPKIVQECVQARARSAIIISAGFKELGEPGLKLEQEILSYARKGNMPIIGPNCLGIMNPAFGLNATFAKGSAMPGQLAFISQSGAMCTSVLDWSLREKIGFSAFISVGSMADVNWGTLIDYFGDDPGTNSLLLYMETVGDARAFLSAAREVALEKPIIVIKAGRSGEAAQAAASHTGSLACSDEVFDAALERVGVLRVNTISELFSMASVLSRQPLPKGPRLSIITNAGGPGVLATDATILSGASLTELAPDTIESLDVILPKAWSRSNPIDILGDADAERYEKTLHIVSKDPGSDGILVVLSPQDMTDPTKTAADVVRCAESVRKPVLASWMGGNTVEEGMKILSEAKIPVFEFPDDAAKTFGTMWRYSRDIQSLYQTPIPDEENAFREGRFTIELRKKESKKLIDSVRKEHRTLLTEVESKKILELYDIPVVETVVAKTVEEAEQYAAKMGYPVVLKVFSQTITHKSDIGGVKLNLKSGEDVVRAFESIRAGVVSHFGDKHFEGVSVQPMISRSGYELILGSSCDPQFGPVLLFGLGGQLVEIFKDKSLGFPPLNRSLARRLMEKTKVFEALQGVRGRKPVNIGLLEDILIRFSHMVVENPRMKECDINPLLVSDEGVIALDARIVLHEDTLETVQLPKLAIRPYPYNYVKSAVLKDGTPVVLRPIRPEDEPLIIKFHKELSENTVRQRYFEFMSLHDRVAHNRLIRICFNDYDREWAIVAEVMDSVPRQIVAIARLSRIPGTDGAQFTMTIVDAFQFKGLGTLLLGHLLSIAEQESIQHVDAYILEENEGMLKLCERAGFTLSKEEPPIVVARKLFTNLKCQNSV